MTPDTPFTITRRQATRFIPLDWDTLTQRFTYEPSRSPTDTTRRAIQRGDTSWWQGPAVANTVVYIVASIAVAGGQTLTLDDSSTFSIGLRNWTRLYWDELKARQFDDSLSYAPSLGLYPGHNYELYPRNDSGSTQLGIFLPLPPDTTDMSVTTVTSGPDSGLFYFAIQSNVGPTYRSFIHPSIVQPLTLPPGVSREAIRDWQLRQNGGGLDTANNRPWCDSALLDSIQRFAKRHEGWTKQANSHWGIGDSVFAAVGTRIQDSIETFVSDLSFNGQPDRVWALNHYAIMFYRPRTPFTVPQADFEQPEYARISRICTFKP